MKVHDWRAALARLEGAYSDNTIRTYRSDVQAYEAWCLEKGIDLFPATPEMLAEFIAARAPLDAASTLRRRLYGIRKIHRLLKLPSLVDDEDVAIALRRALRQKRSRVKQALGLKRELLERLMAACGTDLLGLRDKALLALGYATLCRRAELVAIRVEDFGKVDEDGSVVTARLLPRFSALDASDDVLIFDEVFKESVPDLCGSSGVCQHVLQFFDAAVGQGRDRLFGPGADADDVAV